MTHDTVLLDTDVLIEILRGRPKAGAWLRSISNCTIRIPVFAYLEVLLGARDKRELEKLKKELSCFAMAETRTGDSRIATTWFERFRLSNGVGIIDCFLGAIALRENVPLYTFNVKHYRCLEGIMVRVPYKD
jgi:predicted nucleic acid-binding protein